MTTFRRVDPAPTTRIGPTGNRVKLVLALVGLALACCFTPGLSAVRSPSERESAALGRAAAGPRGAEVRELVELVNRHRTGLDCRPLIWDERLAAVARRHSEDMAHRRFFAHSNPDGEDPFERMRNAGIVYRAAVENIAKGDLNGRTVFEGWLRSRGHRRNLEDCVYTHHGIGLYENHWTHVFVKYAANRP